MANFEIYIPGSLKTSRPAMKMRVDGSDWRQAVGLGIIMLTGGGDSDQAGLSCLSEQDGVLFVTDARDNQIYIARNIEKTGGDWTVAQYKQYMREVMGITLPTPPKSDSFKSGLEMFDRPGEEMKSGQWAQTSLVGLTRALHSASGEEKAVDGLMDSIEEALGKTMAVKPPPASGPLGTDARIKVYDPTHDSPHKLFISDPRTLIVTMGGRRRKSLGARGLGLLDSTALHSPRGGTVALDTALQAAGGCSTPLSIMIDQEMGEGAAVLAPPAAPVKVEEKPVDNEAAPGAPAAEVPVAEGKKPRRRSKTSAAIPILTEIAAETATPASEPVPAIAAESTAWETPVPAKSETGRRKRKTTAEGVRTFKSSDSGDWEIESVEPPAPALKRATRELSLDKAGRAAEVEAEEDFFLIDEWGGEKGPKKSGGKKPDWDVDNVLAEMFMETESLKRFDEEGSCAFTLALIRGFAEAEAGAVFIKKETKDSIHLRVMSAFGNNRNNIQDLTFPPRQGVVGSAVTRNQIVFVERIAEDARHHPEADGWAGTASSVICVPINFKEHTLGALQLINKRDDPFWSEDELTLVRFLADKLGERLGHIDEMRSTVRRLK